MQADRLHQINLWLKNPVAEGTIESFLGANCGDVGEKSFLVVVKTVNNARWQNWGMLIRMIR